MIGIIGAMDEEVKKLREMIQNGKVVKKAGMEFSEIERVVVCTGPRIIYRYKNRYSTFKRIMF